MRRERKPARGLRLALLGIVAIGQRAFLTLWRQPVLVVSTMVFPVVYLLVLGNAHEPAARGRAARGGGRGGQRVLGGVPARRARARERARSLVRGRRSVADRDAALDGLRRGQYRGVWVLPFGLSPPGPAPSFIGDNTDRFSFETLESALQQIWAGGLGAAGRRARRRRPCGSRRIRISTT